MKCENVNLVLILLLWYFQFNKYLYRKQNKTQKETAYFLLLWLSFALYSDFVETLMSNATILNQSTHTKNDKWNSFDPRWQISALQGPKWIYLITLSMLYFGTAIISVLFEKNPLTLYFNHKHWFNIFIFMI